MTRDTMERSTVTETIEGMIISCNPSSYASHRTYQLNVDADTRWVKEGRQTRRLSENNDRSEGKSF